MKKLVQGQHQDIPVFKTVADKGDGLIELCNWLLATNKAVNERKHLLILEKAYRIIQHQRMLDIDRIKLRNAIDEALLTPDFNVYRFIEKWIHL